MPFTFDELLDSQKKKDQEDGETQGISAPAMTGGGETFQGQQTQQAQQPQGVSKQGSGFVNLDKYLTANQNNNFGNQFTGKVQGDVNQAKQSLANNSQDFINASNQGTTRWNDAQPTVKSLVDNAGDNTSSQDVANFQKYSNAQYQGPDSFSGSAYGTKVQGANTKASQEANALQNEGGRFALLDQFYGRPKYNTGEKALDNLLVQNTPGVSARAQSIGNQAKQFTNDLGQKTGELNNVAVSNRQATSDVAKKAKDYVGNAVTGFQTDLGNRYKDYESNTKAYNDARVNDLSDDEFDSDTLGLLGLKEGQNLYDVNLSNYLKQNPMGSPGEFASDQDYAKYLALEQLSGEEPTLLSASDRAKAGTANGKLGFDQDSLNRDILQSKSQYETQIAPVQRAIEESNAAQWEQQQQLDAMVTAFNHGYDFSQADVQKLQELQNGIAFNKQKIAEAQKRYSDLSAAYGVTRKVKQSPVSVPSSDQGVTI